MHSPVMLNLFAIEHCCFWEARKYIFYRQQQQSPKTKGIVPFCLVMRFLHYAMLRSEWRHHRLSKRWWRRKVTKLKHENSAAAMLTPAECTSSEHPTIGGCEGISTGCNGIILKTKTIPPSFHFKSSDFVFPPKWKSKFNYCLLIYFIEIFNLLIARE